MSASQIEALRANGCISAEWFLRNHIPRYAEHYGVGYQHAYQAVLDEHVALTDVRNKNFRQILNSGVANKVLQTYAKQGELANIGERPLIVMDNWVYMMKRESTDDPRAPKTTYYDPLNPLSIRNFHTMKDPIPTQCTSPIVIGRPNRGGELWLDDGFTVEDYNIVKDCFNRLLELRVSGTTPHLQRQLDHIYIPFTLGHPVVPFDPNDIRHDPVDYTGFASELKVTS